MTLRESLQSSHLSILEKYSITPSFFRVMKAYNFSDKEKETRRQIQACVTLLSFLSVAAGYTAF